MKHELTRHEEGQQIVLVALLIPILMVCLGLVIDIGNAYVHRRMVQNAADAAATAAGMVLYGQGRTTAVNTAYWYANQYGYDNNGSSNTVQVTTPSTCVQVDVTEAVEPIFAAIVWDGTFQVRARAKACYRETRLGPSVIVLHETACGALSMDGNNARITVTGGNIHVNSNCASAVELGNGDIATQTPVTIRGSYSSGPNGHFWDLNGQPLPPLTGQVLLPDPLAHLPVPSTTGLPHLSVPKKPTTLQPGIYDNGIKLTGNENVTLQSGIYILNDDFELGGTARVTGHNVFFYLANGATVNFHGNRASQLDAPDSGDYAGVIFFQARDNYSLGHLTGTTDSVLEGIVYMPKGELWLSGNTNLAANFVVDLLRLNGNPDLTVAGYAGEEWTTVTDALVE